MAFCSECGARIADGMRFCMNCGTPAPAAEPASPVDIPAQEPVYDPVEKTVAVNPFDEVYNEPEPEPVFVAPDPEPVYRTPDPEPVYRTPDPEPVYRAPDPEPVYRAPDPEPVYTAPVPPQNKPPRRPNTPPNPAPPPYQQGYGAPTPARPAYQPPMSSGSGLGFGAMIGTMLGGSFPILGNILTIGFVLAGVLALTNGMISYMPWYSLALYALGAIRLVVNIVWACGGAKNTTRKAFSRANLLFMLIGVVISVVLYLVFQDQMRALIGSFSGYGYYGW